jgi:hypothetical protein
MSEKKTDFGELPGIPAELGAKNIALVINFSSDKGKVVDVTGVRWIDTSKTEIIRNEAAVVVGFNAPIDAGDFTNQYMYPVKNDLRTMGWAVQNGKELIIGKRVVDGREVPAVLFVNKAEKK